MSLGEILYTILIMPLQLFFEVIFMFVNYRVNNPGISIIILSLIVNILVLPLYMRADAMQEAERVLEAKLKNGVTHIKRTFKGDERMMMLQTYYRQNNYKPTDVFKGSVSLLLEIPFFIAAYHFLSNLALLTGSSFGPISDLGVPDALIHIGTIDLNLLPFVMTAVNLLSCIIFTKGHTKKTKFQLYGMAVFFLIFLYDSPSGLVFYWTLNNLFSLVKTIFYKLKNPGKILKILSAVAGFMLVFWVKIVGTGRSIKNDLFIMAIAVLLLLPILVEGMHRFLKFHIPRFYMKPNRRLFFCGSIYLTALVGIMIPSSVIASSPQEFINIQHCLNPVWYIFSSACLAGGLFVIWFLVFYWLAGEKHQCYFDVGIWMVAVIATVDYLIFTGNQGILNSTLQYTSDFVIQGRDQIINLMIISALMIFLIATYKGAKKYIPKILILACLAFFIVSVRNIYSIIDGTSKYDLEASSKSESGIGFKLSKEGKNVVVIMLDRAMGEYVPYMINEKPELKERLSGFTYYPNTISFGGFTNFGASALYGGYEYTPVEMNKRANESLEEKHNEALKVMPSIFLESGYDVTVCDPTYAGYQWIPDLSIYNDYPEISTYITRDIFSLEEGEEKIIGRKRNFFCYSMMKVAPLVMQRTLYDNGMYFHHSYGTQQIEDNYHAQGISSSFMGCYATLENLDAMTEIVDEASNTFLMISNDTTHEPALLQEPEYVPAEYVDNMEYEVQNADRFLLNDVKLNMKTSEHYAHYQTNMAVMLSLAGWMDFLKENDIYDNTRIIIVADHGRGLNQIENLNLDGTDEMLNTEYYYPLLMIKDFNSREFTVSDEFMTNGDVPTYAFKDLIDNPINPFTGKVINNKKKNNEKQYVLASPEWDANKNNGNQFLPGRWLSVHDNRLDKDNWEILNEGVFPE